MERKLGRKGPPTAVKPHMRTQSLPEPNIGVLRQNAMDSNHNSATYEDIFNDDEDDQNMWRSSFSSWKMKRNQVASDVLERKALREEVDEVEQSKGRRKPKTFREIVQEKQRREKILAKKLERKKDLEKEEIHAILTSVDLIDSEESDEDEEDEITPQQEAEQYAEPKPMSEMRSRASTHPSRSKSQSPTSPHKPAPIAAISSTASTQQKAPPSVAPKPKYRPSAGAFRPYHRSQSLKEGVDFTDKPETDDTHASSPSPTLTTPSEESYPAQSFHEKLLRDRERDKELTEAAKVGQEKARRPTQKRMSMGILGRIAAFNSGEAFKKKDGDEEEQETSKPVKAPALPASQQSRTFREVTITMNKRPRSQGGFGFFVTGGIDKKKPIVVKGIEPGGTADRSDLKVGDEIIVINKEKTKLFDHDDIQYSISQAVLSGNLNLKVRRYGDDDTESSTSPKQLKSPAPVASSNAAPPPTKLSPLSRDEPAGESQENGDMGQSQARNALYRAKKLLDALDTDETSSDETPASCRRYFDGETGETGYCNTNGDYKSSHPESWTESDRGSKQPALHQASLESTEPPSSILSPSPSHSPLQSVSLSPITSPSPPPDDPAPLHAKVDDLLMDRRDSRVSDGLDDAHRIKDELNDTYGTEDSFFASEGTREEDLTSTEEERLEEEIMDRLEKEEKREKEREEIHRQIEDDEKDKSPVKELLISPALMKTEESAPPPSFTSLRNSKPLQFRSVKGPRPFVPKNKGPEPFRPQPKASVIVHESDIREHVKQKRTDFFTDEDDSSPPSDQNVEDLWKQVENKSLDASTPEKESVGGDVQRRFNIRNNANVTNRKSFNLEEEKRRLEKWQKEQERILQEQYAQEQRRLREEQEQELQRAQEEMKRKQEMEMKALEERKRMLQKKADEELKKKEEERLEKERLERERRMKEKLLRAEEERRLREEEERLNHEREEEERLEREQREREDEERRKDDALMFAMKRQEEERKAKEREKQRIREEREERERKARERIQREREEYEKLLKERELEKERLALEQVEKQRLAQEQVENQRLAQEHEEKLRVQLSVKNNETIRPRVAQQQESAPPPYQTLAQQSSPPQTQLDIERIREEERERIRMEERERLRQEWEELEREKLERQRKEEQHLEKLRAEQAELQRDRQRLEQQHKDEKERLVKEKEKIYHSSKSLDDVLDDNTEKTNTYNRKNRQLTDDDPKKSMTNLRPHVYKAPGKDVIDKRMVPERDVKPEQVYMSKYKDENIPTEQHWLVEEAKRRQQEDSSDYITNPMDLLSIQPRKDGLDHEPVLERKVYSEQQSAPTPNTYTKPHVKDYRKSEPPGYEQEIPTRIPPPHRDQGSPPREKQSPQPREQYSADTNRWDAPRHKYDTQPEFRHVQRRMHGQPDPERKRKMHNRRSLPELDQGRSYAAPVSRIKDDPPPAHSGRGPGAPPGGSLKAGGGPPPGGLRGAPPPAGPGGDVRRNGPAPDAIIQNILHRAALKKAQSGRESPQRPSSSLSTHSDSAVSATSSSEMELTGLMLGSEPVSFTAKTVTATMLDSSSLKYDSDE